MTQVTVTYSYNYDKDKIEKLESDSNVSIISKRTVIGDTIHMLPLHVELHPSYLMYNVTYTYKTKLNQSPRQDTLTPTSLGVRVPKTRGGTDEFIRAFWINGKPKCRIGYSYDFNRKMCRLIK